MTARRPLQRLFKATSGGTATVFAVAAPVIALMAMISVELTTAGNTRASLQGALDSAVLAAAVSDAETNAEVTQVITDYLNGAWTGRPSGVTLGVVATRNPETGAISASASASLNTMAASLIGQSAVPIKVRSDAVSGVSANLEMALVLDTTGSMDGARLTRLKSVATDMVNTLMEEPTVKVAIVPFADLVNVGVGARNEPWLDVPPDVPETTSCGDVTSMVGETCVTTPATCTYDGASYACTNTSCSGGVPSTSYQCHTRSAETWTGCVGSRPEPRNTDDTNYSVKVPGLITTGCPTPILGLTDNKASVTGALDDLAARGETYLPLGMVWGWRVLSAGAPFTGGMADTYTGTKARKTIVFMSDGVNTRSKDPSSAWNSGSDAAAADKLFEELCDKVKDEKIEVYTVAFQIAETKTKKMLASCATSKDHAFTAANDAQLSKAFEQIAQDLKDVRLTH